jgi:hypothetical protein
MRSGSRPALQLDSNEWTADSRPLRKVLDRLCGEFTEAVLAQVRSAMLDELFAFAAR